jgi:hypothetical protein
MNTRIEVSSAPRDAGDDFWMSPASQTRTFPLDPEWESLTRLNGAKEDFFERSDVFVKQVKPLAAGIDTLMQYATLFHQKTEKYLASKNKIIIGNAIMTKVVLTETAKNFNQKEAILLNKSALESCTLKDLLK